MGVSSLAVSAVHNVEVLPNNPHDSSDLTCVIYNPPQDLPPQVFYYRWFRNDIAEESISGIAEFTVADSYTNPGDEWTCEVYYWVDGQTWSIGGDYFDTVIIEEDEPQNNAPTIVDFFPLAYIIDRNNSFQLFCDTNDDNTLPQNMQATIQYKLTGYDSWATINPNQITNNYGTFSTSLYVNTSDDNLVLYGTYWDFRCIATDEQGLTATSNIGGGIVFNNYPTITGQIPAISLTENQVETINLDGYGSDVEDPANSLTWSIYDVPAEFTAEIVGEGNDQLRLIAPSNINQPQSHVIRLRPVDSEGHGSLTSMSVTVNLIQGVDQPAVWQTLEDQTVAEGSPAGTIVYQNIASQCNDPDDTEIISVTSTHSNYSLSLNQGNLVITIPDSNYFDEVGELVTLSCNGVPASFTLRINNVDDPGYWTVNNLQPQTVLQGNPYDEAAYPALLNLCRDIDSTPFVEIINYNNQHYNLTMQGIDLRFTSLDNTYFDTGRQITVRCSGGQQKTFMLTIEQNDAPQILESGFTQSPLTTTRGNTIQLTCTGSDSQTLPENLIAAFRYRLPNSNAWNTVPAADISNFGANHYANIYTNTNDNQLGTWDFECSLTDEFGATGIETDLDTVLVNNNIPEIVGSINLPLLSEGETYSVSLTPFEEDFEDSGTDLTWSVFESSNILTATINNPTEDRLLIAIADELTAPQTIDIFLTLHDTDNGIAQRTIQVLVQPTDDPAYWIANLTTRQVDEDSLDGTVVYNNVESYCFDPDGTANVTVISSHNHYNLMMDNFGTLRIYDLESNYNNVVGENVILSCNGDSAQAFSLRIAPVNDIPVVTDIIGYTNPDSGNITFNAIATDIDGNNEIIGVEFEVYYDNNWHLLGEDTLPTIWSIFWESLNSIDTIDNNVRIQARARDAHGFGLYHVEGPFTVDNTIYTYEHDLALSNTIFPLASTFVAGNEIEFSTRVENTGDYVDSSTLKFMVDGDTVTEYDIPNLSPGTTTGAYTALWTAEEGDHTVSIEIVPVQDEENIADNFALNNYYNISYEQLSVESIECFSVVVAGHDQSCSVYVTDSDNNPLEDVNVTISFEDGSLFGTCVTGLASSGCEAQHTMESVGNYRVYAHAQATGYSSDNDNMPFFDFIVISEGYDIQDLKIFNASTYGLEAEDYEFYRGETMFVSFKAEDLTTGEYVSEDDVLTSVALVSPPGGRINLTFVEYIDATSEFRFYLNQIPTTHHYLGLSQTFAFAFDDNEGGEEEVSLMILNNIPVITTDFADITTNVNNVTLIDLSAHEFDVEDNNPGLMDDNLSWNVVVVDGGIVSAQLSGKLLTLTGLTQGVTQVVLRLTDLDGDYDEKSFSVNVGEEIIYLHDLSLTDSQVPQESFDNVETEFSTIVVNNGDYSENSVLRFFVDGTEVDSCRSVLQLSEGEYTPRIYCNVQLSAGEHLVRISVDNVVGESNTQNNIYESIVEVLGVNDISALIVPDKTSGEAPLTVFFKGIGTGTGKLTYKWTFSDGKSGASTQNVYHVFEDEGTYTVTLIVTDQLGRSASDTQEITVGEENNDHIAKRRVKIGQLNVISNEYVRAGDELELKIVFDNIGLSDLEDFKTVVVVPDLAMRAAAGPFDVEHGDRVMRIMVLDIPKDAPPGTYDVRITMSNDDTRRIKHRTFMVVE